MSWSPQLGLLVIGLSVACTERSVGPPTADLAGGADRPADLSTVDLATADAAASSDLAAGSFDLGAPSSDLPPISDLGLVLGGNRLLLDGGTEPLATLTITVRDGDDDSLLPAMVVFRPPPGSGFTENLWAGAGTTPPSAAGGAVVGPGVVGTRDGVMLVSGQGQVPVPAGTYEIFVTAGPEREGVTQSITVGSGQLVPIAVTLDRSVDTGGWLATDLHVHTQRSFDSKILLQRRVVSMVTAGLEILVPTDHNVATDLTPEIGALGYATRVGQVIGNEFNFNPGHGGAYPVPYDPTHPYGGAPAWTPTCGGPGEGINCKAPDDAFALMHEQLPGKTFVAVNHPWMSGSDLGYFTNIGWGAGTSQTTVDLPGRDRIDGLEILNAYVTDPVVIGYLLEDWFALLDTGRRVLALGNSDTHALIQNRAGYPRNWLRTATDDPTAIDGDALATALQAGGVVASTGPFLRLTVDGVDIGGTAVDSDGSVEIAVEVDAPLWIPIDRVAVYLNGTLYQELPVTGQPQTRPRLQATFTMTVPVGEDSYVVAIASSDAALPADVVGVSGMQAWAIANPVWIDGNARRGWQRPPRRGPRRMSPWDPRVELRRRVLHLRPEPDDGSFESWAAETMPRWFDP